MLNILLVFAIVGVFAILVWLYDDFVKKRERKRKNRWSLGYSANIWELLRAEDRARMQGPTGEAKIATARMQYFRGNKSFEKAYSSLLKEFGEEEVPPEASLEFYQSYMRSARRRQPISVEPESPTKISIISQVHLANTEQPVKTRMERNSIKSNGSHHRLVTEAEYLEANATIRQLLSVEGMYLIRSWEVSANYETEIFEVKTPKWTLVWSGQEDTDFSITICNADNSADCFIVTNGIFRKSKEATVPLIDAGRFYLKITSSKKYKIQVYDRRSIDIATPSV